MNIFVLADSPVEAARLQCDKHVVKMILETAQLLSTAHQVLDGVKPDMYKITHKNHPCAVWARQTDLNYLWLYAHFVALCDEYTYRYGKIHKTDSRFRDVLSLMPENIKYADMTIHPICMGTNPECIKPGDVVGSYRDYYKTKQSKFKMTWTKREVPDWFNGETK